MHAVSILDAPRVVIASKFPHNYNYGKVRDRCGHPVFADVSMETQRGSAACPHITKIIHG